MPASALHPALQLPQLRAAAQLQNAPSRTKVVKLSSYCSEAKKCKK